MPQKRSSQKNLAGERDTRELLEGLRKDILMLLLETEGLVAFRAEQHRIRNTGKSQRCGPIEAD